MRAFLMAVLILVLVCVLACAGALAYVNMTWLPTHGKPQLERALSERTHLHVTIGRLSYRLPLGVMALDMRLTDPQHRAPDLRFHHVSAHVAPWPLLRERRVRGVIAAQLQAPVTASGTVRGVYDWDAQTLQAHVRVPLLEVDALRALWPASWAVALQRGTLSCDVDVAVAPEQPTRLSGTARMQRLELTMPDPGLTLRGELGAEGAGSYDGMQRHWQGIHGTLALHRGTLLLHDAEEFTEIELAAQVQETAMRATVDSRAVWRRRHPLTARGTIDLTAPFGATLDGTADIQLDPALYDLLPPVATALQPQGTLAVTARWQGPLQAAARLGQPLPVDISAIVRDGALNIPGRTEGLSSVAGTIRYHEDSLDVVPLTFLYVQAPYTLTARLTALSHEPHLLARLHHDRLTSQLDATLLADRISIARWETTFLASQLKLMGDVTRAQPPVVNIYGEGAVELAELPRWPGLTKLPAEWPMRGIVPVSLLLEGPADLRALRGGLKLGAAEIAWRDVPVLLDRADARWDQGRLTLDTVSARISGGTVVGDGGLTLPWPQGACAGRLSIDRVQIEPIMDALQPEAKQPTSGLAIARLHLAGDACTPEGLHGDGEFLISEGRLASIPLLDKLVWGLLGGLADRLGYTELRHAELTQASGQWALANKKITTNDTLLVAQYAGSPIPIEIRGWVGLDQALDLTVDTRLPPDLLSNAPNLPPAMRALGRALATVGDLKNRLGRQRITGTLEQPVSRFEFAFEDVLQGLAIPKLQDFLFPPQKSP